MKSIYQEVLLAAAEEILLLVAPDSLAILAANPAACRVLGYPVEDLTGMTITDIECALADVFFWEEVRGGGAIEEQVMEGLYRRADGSLLAASKSVRRIAQGVLIRAPPTSAPSSGPRMNWHSWPHACGRPSKPPPTASWCSTGTVAWST